MDSVDVLTFCFSSFILLAIIIAIKNGWLKSALALLFWG